jgi:ribose transport system ATP-binding protein
MLAGNGLKKSFGGVEAVRGVSIEAHPGSLLALLGENGAGKSTLVRILAGDTSPDAGTITIGEQVYASLSPRTAKHAGIRLVSQEIAHAPDLSVAENIVLGDWPTKRGFVSWRGVQRRAREALNHLGSQIEPDRHIRDLSLAEQQVVEIARAILGECRYLILDEPTAALSASECDHLFDVLGRLLKLGIAAIYITHRLDEVHRIADRVQVLRDGQTVLVGDVATFRSEDLVEAMVGRHVTAGQSLVNGTARSASAVPILAFRDASMTTQFRHVDVEVHAHEVVGLYGKIGSGTAAVAAAGFGLMPLTSGETVLYGKAITISSPRMAVKLGIGLVPADRLHEGAFMMLSAAHNLCAPSWEQIARKGTIISRGMEQRAYRPWKTRLDIRSSDTGHEPIRALSGGNQQKVLLARWLERGARFLFLLEPTRGVDVGARESIYAAIRATLAESDIGMLVVTSDAEEALRLCDRLVVMQRGRISARFERHEATLQALAAAVGE